MKRKKNQAYRENKKNWRMVAASPFKTSSSVPWPALKSVKTEWKPVGGNSAASHMFLESSSTWRLHGKEEADLPSSSYVRGVSACIWVALGFLMAPPQLFCLCHLTSSPALCTAAHPHRAHGTQMMLSRSSERHLGAGGVVTWLPGISKGLISVWPIGFVTPPKAAC